LPSKMSGNDIKHHQNSCMPHVAKIINRHSTNIDSYMFRIDWVEGFFCLTESIEDLKHMAILPIFFNG